MSDITTESTDRFLGALGEQLAARGERFELVVIGGSGLLALGLIERAAQDVDIVAFHSDGDLDSADPLPEGLVAARDLVARDFSLLPRWLNPGPAKLLEFGLPDGFVDRLPRRGDGGGPRC